MIFLIKNCSTWGEKEQERKLKKITHPLCTWCEWNNKLIHEHLQESEKMSTTVVASCLLVCVWVSMWYDGKERHFMSIKCVMLSEPKLPLQ
jgi:hypothetical protein